MPMRHGGRLTSRASTCPRDHFHDCTTFIVPHHVKRILADIDTDHGDCRIELVWHGVLLVFGAPFQLPLLAGPEHGRTIPLYGPAVRCKRTFIELADVRSCINVSGL